MVIERGPRPHYWPAWKNPDVHTCVSDGITWKNAAHIDAKKTSGKVSILALKNTRTLFESNTFSRGNSTMLTRAFIGGSKHGVWSTVTKQGARNPYAGLQLWYYLDQWKCLSCSRKQVGITPRALNHYGAPNHYGGRQKVAKMSQVLSSMQYICFRKTSGSNTGAPSLTRAPSNLVAPMSESS